MSFGGMKERANDDVVVVNVTFGRTAEVVEFERSAWA